MYWNENIDITVEYSLTGVSPWSTIADDETNDGSYQWDTTSFPDRNSYRMNPYHRLDLGATRVFVKRKHYSDFTFSIYNVYSRMNPYFIYYDVSGNVESGDVEVQAKQASLFPILPSITWNFKFKK